MRKFRICPWVSVDSLLGRAPTVLILLTPLNNRAAMQKEKSQANLWWRRPDPPWPWRYPWISVGVLGTDGGHLGRLPLYFPPPPLLRHILLPLSICSFPFVSSFAESLVFSFFLSPFLFLSALFIYSFGPAAALCPLARRPVGCPPRRWTLLLRILLLSKQQRSTTSCPSEDTVPYPRLAEEGKKEGVSTWQVHTSLRSGPANFGYSPCQYRRSFSWHIEPSSRHSFSILISILARNNISLKMYGIFF